VIYAQYGKTTAAARQQAIHEQGDAPGQVSSLEFLDFATTR